MAKPLITFRSDTDPYPLTYDELDTNFLNLRDSTINFTGDAGDTRSMDLNDATAITGERNIKVTVDEATQSIKIRNTLSDYTTDPNGFENRTDSTLSFNSSTRVFTIAPTSTDYEIWNQGQQYTISTSKTVTITNTTGIYLVYFDGSTLSFTSGAEPTWASQTPVSYVYWNATTSEFLFTDERHGIRMDASTKEYLHETAAMAYAEGFDASNYTITGTGANNADAQLDIGNGVCYDQDIRVEITHSNSPAANTWQQDLQGPARIPVVYHSGATGAWRVDTARDFPVKNGTSLVTYNLNTGGTWSTPDCTSTYYVAYWIVATNFLNTPIISVMGQRQDNKLSDAVINNTWTSLDLTNFPAEEFRPLYRVIVRTASGYANTPKAYFAQVDDARLDHIAVSGAAGGSGTVNTGTQYRLAYYPADGTTIDDLTSIYVSPDGQTLYSPGISGPADSPIRTIGITSNIGGANAGSVTWANGNSSAQQYTRIAGYFNTSPARIDVGRNRSGTIASNIYIQPGAGGNIILDVGGTETSITVTTNSTKDLILNTNNGTNSGSITILDGANQNITIAPNGTGAIVLDGEVDINANIASTPANTTTVVAWLEVGSNGSVYYLPLYQ